MFDQVEQNGQRLLISDLVGHVDRRAFKVLGHPYLTDTLCDRVAFCRQLTPGKAIVEGCAHWIAECNLHAGIAFLEGARNSTQSPATADDPYQTVVSIGVARSVIASAAKQSRGRSKELDCFVASAPRKDGVRL